jgi:NAD(P)-dependent dehydrogenase (short-subunit alcohol dehydrogenase family)
LQLARRGPSRIYMGARNEGKARDAITSIQSTLSSSVDIRHVPLDLSSFDSIRTASEIFTSECDRLDILMLNAGTLGNLVGTTDAGHEIQFGTNHVGHFLLTKLLLPALLNTAALSPSPDVRVVTLSSIMSGTSPPFDIMTSATRLTAETTWHRYAASKAANILFASELARRHPNIMSVSVHPGIVNSDIWDQAKTTSSVMRYPLQIIALSMRSVRTGALNQLWAAGADRELLENGAFYNPIGVIQRNNQYVVDVALGKKLWDWTDAEVRKFGF